MNVINNIFEDLSQLNGNKLVTLYTFLMKTDFPLTNGQFIEIIKQIKECILEKRFDKAEDPLTSLKIYMKISAKTLTTAKEPQDHKLYPYL